MPNAGCSSISSQTWKCKKTCCASLNTFKRKTNMRIEHFLLHSFVVLYVLSAGLLLPACLLCTGHVESYTHHSVFDCGSRHGTRAVCVTSLTSCDRRDVSCSDGVQPFSVHNAFYCPLVEGHCISPDMVRVLAGKQK